MRLLRRSKKVLNKKGLPLDVHCLVLRINTGVAKVCPSSIYKKCESHCHPLQAINKKCISCIEEIRKKICVYLIFLIKGC